MRGQEGKDGNPLNEVRMLAASIIDPAGRLIADKSIKYDPDRSVLGYRTGDPITVTAENFAKLSSALLDAVEQKFPPKAATA